MKLKNTFKKRVVVFGIFDGLHAGHEHFLRQARACGDELIVIVGRQEVARKLKGKTPKLNELQRRARVASCQFVNKAVLGDKEMGKYRVFQLLKPDVVCFGYDQIELKKDIVRWIKKNNLEINSRVMGAYKPKEYHTSLLKNPRT